MSKKIKFVTTVPKTVPKYYVVEPQSVNYSQPKLYIPKDKSGRPTVDRPWYVWFSYRNPETGKFDGKSKFIYKRGINRKYKTVEGRKRFGKQLIEVFTRLLEEGFNPYDKTIYYTDETETEMKFFTLQDGLEYAFELKKKEIARSTKSDWKYRLNKFLDWAMKTGIENIKIEEITSINIAAFFNSLAREGQSPKSINNYRGCLSALWSKLVNDMIVTNNPVILIKKRKETPRRNKPFTPDEIKKIREYLQKTDPVLLLFIRLVGFAFLRPVEIARLTVGDIDLQRNMLTVRTKTETRATVRIVPQLAMELKKLNLGQYAKTDFLFTRDDVPGAWINARTGKPAAENTRTKVFSDRFNDLKKHFGWGDEYGIYSIRHSFAVDLYNSFINSGLTSMEAELKMLPITRHKSISGLRNYLRDVGALLPKDYGKNFSIRL